MFDKTADMGNPITTPAYDPLNAMVASRDRSSGGAQNLQMPWHAGYVTPFETITISMVFVNSHIHVILSPTTSHPPHHHHPHLHQSLDDSHANQDDRIQVDAQRYEHIAKGRSDDSSAKYLVGRKEGGEKAAGNLSDQVAPKERGVDGALHVRGPGEPGSDIGHRVVRMVSGFVMVEFVEFHLKREKNKINVSLNKDVTYKK